MAEQGTEFNDIEVEDTMALVPVSQVDGPDEDDVEGHVQPPRGDDTDHVHSLVRQ
jgi:hypothetical protein